MFPKPVTKASSSFSYVAFGANATLHGVYLVGGSTCIPMMNVKMSMRCVNRRGSVGVSACPTARSPTRVCPTITCRNRTAFTTTAYKMISHA